MSKFTDFLSDIAVEVVSEVVDSVVDHYVGDKSVKEVAQEAVHAGASTITDELESVAELGGKHD